MKMTRPLIAIVAATALFFVYLWDVRRVEYALLADLQGQQLLFHDPTRAVQLRFENEEGVLVLERPGGPGEQWRITEPRELLANNDSVNAFLENLRGARRHAQFAPTNLEDQGLAEPRRTVSLVLRDNGETVTRSIHFGSQPQEFGHVYARVEGEDRIFTVSEWVFRQAGMTIGDIRDRSLAHTPLDRARELRIENRSGTFTLERAEGTDTWRVTRGVAVPLPADRGLLDRMTGNFHRAALVDIHDDPTSTTAQMGFDNPAASVTADGRTLFKVGMRVPDRDQFLVLTEDGTIGSAPISAVADLFRPAQEWGTKRFVWIPRSDLQQIETRSGNTSMMLMNQEGDWVFPAMMDVPVRDAALQEFLDNLYTFSARQLVTAELDEEEWRGYGITPETYAVHVRANDGTTHGFRFGRTDSREGTTYVLRIQDDSLWKVDFRAQSGVFKFINDLQERRMLPGLADRTARFEVEVGEHRMSFERTPAAWRATLPGERPTLIAPVLAENFLYAFEALEVESELITNAFLPPQATFRFYDEDGGEPFATVRLISRSATTRIALFEYDGKQLEVAPEPFDVFDDAMASLFVGAQIQAEEDR